MKLKMTKSQVAQLMEALTHSSASTHHSHCHTHKVGGGNGCDCHVQKADNALQATKAAVEGLGYRFSYSAKTLSKNSSTVPGLQ